MGKSKLNHRELKTLNLHLTNRCNMLCRHCLYSAGEKKINEMTLQEVQRLIKEFARISKNQGTLNLFGGEVFLRRDIFDIIDYSLSFGLTIGITTNANLSKGVVKKIIRRDIGRLSIDIDGANSDSHDWLRNKKGHLNQSLRTIKLFIKAGKFTASNIILHRDNAQEIEEILTLCQKVGISFISCYLFTALGRGKNIENLVLGPLEWKETREKVKEWMNNNHPDYGIIWERAYEYTNHIDRLSPALCCGGSSDVIDVRCDGNVYYCGLLSGVDFGCLGNVTKETLTIILSRREKCAVGINSGCVALAYSHNPEKLIDPRPSVNEIIPVCPYDWEVLRAPSLDLRRKFAHINP